MRFCLQFNKQLRKAEGQKVTPKVELLINVDGIALQDPKTKVRNNIPRALTAEVASCRLSNGLLCVNIISLQISCLHLRAPYS